MKQVACGMIPNIAPEVSLIAAAVALIIKENGIQAESAPQFLTYGARLRGYRIAMTAPRPSHANVFPHAFAVQGKEGQDLFRAVVSPDGRQCQLEIYEPGAWENEIVELAKDCAGHEVEQIPAGAL